jgi:hypothetical protein
MQYLRRIGIALVGVFIWSSLQLSTLAKAGEVRQRGDIEMSEISGDLQKPRRHFRLRDPADLRADEASEVYAIVNGALRAGYERSGLATARTYQDWQRYNTAPYFSLSHGNHYLNNYANAKASAYGMFEQAGKLPAGAIIAKDSFSVATSREIVLGPLFIMEKMPAGFNGVTGDWKFIQIQPDGTLLGETNGTGAERVEYCIACHLAAVKHDHLYFVPKEYRIRSQP